MKEWVERSQLWARSRVNAWWRSSPSRFEWCWWCGVWAVALVVALFVPAWGGLPSRGAARDILSAFLQAEAAFVALGLVVIVFLLEAVRSRPDLDDDIFAAFLLRLQLVRVFEAGLVMVGVVAAAFILAQPTPDGAPWQPLASTGNFVVGSLLALGLTLLSVGWVFVGMLGIMTPSRWRGLRRQVLRGLTEVAVDAYLERSRRIAEMAAPEFSDIFRVEPAESRADESVRTLIEDAKRAFHEKRLNDFKEVLDTVRDLLDTAMDRIMSAGFEFSDGGAGWLTWPPLRAVERELAMLRREVALGGWSDFAYEVSRLDTWLIRAGCTRLAGEVLEVGLVGLEQSYRFALERNDDELQRILRERLWRLMHESGLHELTRASMTDTPRARILARRIVRQQSRLLETALRHNRADDVRRLVEALGSLLNVLPGGAADDAHREYLVLLSEELKRLHQLVLLGILGLAVERHAADPEGAKPFLVVGRGAFRSLDGLAQDLVFALDNWHDEGLEWSRWETADVPDFKVVSIRPEDYPIAYFTVRALELVTVGARAFRVGDRASWVRDIVSSHIDRWAAFAEVAEVDLSMDDRKAILLGLLDEAVTLARQDEDVEMAEKPLDPGRVADFVADLYEHSVEAATVESLFAAAERSWYVDPEESTSPLERGPKPFLTHKGPFTDAANWMDLDPRPLAISLAEDLGRGLVDALTGAPQSEVPITDLSTASVLAAIRAAAAELAAARAVVLLIGDWGDVLVELAVQRPDGWLERWRMPPSGSDLFLAGSVDGMPVVRLDGDERAVYVVDPGKWGCLIRADCDGRELRADVALVTADEADAAVRKDRKLFAKERTLAARARKLRTFVKLSVSHRKAFLVRDTSHARRVPVLEAARVPRQRGRRRRP